MWLKFVALAITYLTSYLLSCNVFVKTEGAELCLGESLSSQLDCSHNVAVNECLATMQRLKTNEIAGDLAVVSRCETQVILASVHEVFQKANECNQANYSVSTIPAASLAVGYMENSTYADMTNVVERAGEQTTANAANKKNDELTNPGTVLAQLPSPTNLASYHLLA